MTKPEGPFRFDGGKNIVLFRGRKKVPDNFLTGSFGINILNITPGSESRGVLTGAEIHNGGDHPGVGDAKVRAAVAKIGPSPRFGENVRSSVMRGPEPRRPIQFP
jgi:hypothetical protein